MENLVIIGGGVAGLSCMNALLDKGYSPLLLEEKTIGLPKVCGEFLAPLASSQLQEWEIGPIQTIKEANFIVDNKRLNLTFAHPAGAFSRTAAELGLAERAYRKGGRIQEHSKINKIDPPLNHSPYLIHLDSGEQILAKTVIMATGKFNPCNAPLAFPYQGFKIHLPQVVKAETLFMCHYPGAYFGIVPTTSKSSNLTCLAQKKVIDQWGSCTDFFQHLITVTPLLKDIDFSSIQWLEGKAPEFKIQTIPNWKNAFWIGDAVASFYPALGYGFAHSVHSALSAAHFYHHADASGYHTFIKNEIKWKLKLGKIIHHALMNRSLSNFILTVSQKSPTFTQMLMSKAGYS